MYEEYTKRLSDIQKLIDFACENNMSIDKLVSSLELLKTMKLDETRQATDNLLKGSDDLFKKILGNIEL